VQTNNKYTQQLSTYAKPEKLISDSFDNDAPLSFIDWYAGYKSVIPGQEYKQYNQYLIDWYSNKKVSNVDTITLIRLNYLTLLQGLQIFLTDIEKENWYSKVNLNDEKELLLAIPFFAKKLKNISLYYLNLRKQLKPTKLKYNLVGSNRGLVQDLRQTILNQYTQKNNSYITVPSTIWQSLPALSSVNNTLNIQIEEFYDDHQYFDRSIDVPLSAYVDPFDATTESFFNSKGLSLSSLNWAYSSGTINISADSMQDYTEKFLGENRDIIYSLITNASADYFNISLNSGNNFFYFPSGVYESIALSNPIYDGIALSSTNIESLATAASNISSADTIFVKTSRGIEGAWLNAKIYDVNSSAALSAYFAAGSKTVFRYPFAGYGLSGDGIEWSGPSLQYNPTYSFLDLYYRTAVDQAYWSSTYTLSSVQAITVNSTTLAESKAYASSVYKYADKIRIWDNPPPSYTDSNYSGEITEAWLYRIDKTDLSISANGNSVLYWPYLKVVDSTLSAVNLLPTNVKICESAKLSAIQIPLATASDNLSSADVVYKIKKYDEDSTSALEAAWLSGSYINNGNLQGVKQNGFNAELEPGVVTRFLWTGEDTPIDNVFQSLIHEVNCPYTQDWNYNDHSFCTCRQIQFTPFGHNGVVYTDNGSFADFIAEDEMSPQEFDLNSWRGVDGLGYSNSSGFAWYKTSLTTPNWGYGEWTNGSLNATLTLRKGQNYFYYRCIEPFETSDSVSFPSLVVRYPYKDNSGVVWVKAYRDVNGVWYSSNTASDMVIGANEFILYSKASVSTYSLSSLVEDAPLTSGLLSSIWSTYDLAVIDDQTTVSVSYPNSYVVNASAVSSQYPSVRVTDISAYSWQLTTPDGTIYTTDPITGDLHSTSNVFPTDFVVDNVVFNSNFSISFVPTLTGLYLIQVSAYINSYALSAYKGLLTGGAYIFTNIPAVTAVSSITYTPSVSSYTTPVAGFVINTPLYGWNYATSIYDGKSQGARPVWVKGITDKSQVNNYKSAESWGNIRIVVDGQNIINQPDVSDLVLNSGSYFEYYNNNLDVYWGQPLTLLNYINTTYWSEIIIDDSSYSVLSSVSNFNTIVLNTTASDTPSTIVLNNFVDNNPVEIYYNAINSFTWTISAYKSFSDLITQNDFTLSAGLISQLPWYNLSNRNYPTVAVIPTLQDIYTEDDKGGYFTPNNLGTSLYIGKNFTTGYNTSAISVSALGENANFRVGGRGFSKKDQDSAYNVLNYNDTWIKENYLAGNAAGNIQRNVAKKYQKFTPYQSNNETHTNGQVGIVTPQSKHSPWGGLNDEQWIDVNNHPVSFSGEVNVDAWADTQILLQGGKRMDVWCSDVFGNQYGLYKNIDNVSPALRKEYFGDLWIRKNNQFVDTATNALSSIITPYKNLSLYNDLTGGYIRNVDVFFDTLMIETSSAIIFEKLNYDYSLSYIYGTANSNNVLSLGLPVLASLSRELNGDTFTEYAITGDTWFFPSEKKVFLSVIYLSGGVVYPEIYGLDINTNNFYKAFPVLSEDSLDLASLSGVNTIIGRPVLSYDYDAKEYVFSTLFTNLSGQNSLIEIIISDNEILELKGATMYTPNNATIGEPPIVLNELNFFVPTLETFSTTLSVLNTPTSILLGNALPWITLNTNTLLLSGIPQNNGIYTIPLTLTNSYGSTYYTVKVVSMANLPEVISSLNIQITADSVGYYNVVAINNPISYTLLDNSLSAWVSFNSVSAIFTLSPSADQAGDNSIPFKVTNAFGDSYYTLNITVVLTGHYAFDTFEQYITGNIVILDRYHNSLGTTYGPASVVNYNTYIYDDFEAYTIGIFTVGGDETSVGVGMSISAANIVDY